MWTVKPGKVEEFIKAWQASVEWLVENHTAGWDGEALLLQDIRSSNQFISFAWSTDLEKTEDLFARTEFQAIMAGIQEFCEEIQPHGMRVVGYLTSQ
jgi:hypothetical protein